MNLIVSIKKLTSNIYQISINRSEELKALVPGAWVQFKLGADSTFYFAVIDELRNETVRLIMPRNSMPSSLSVGDRIESLSVFQNPHLETVVNQEVLCVANGDGALVMLPLVKDLLRNGCRVSLMLSDGPQDLFASELFRKSSSFKLITVDSASFFNHSLTSPIYSYIVQQQPVALYAIGSASLTTDTLKALSGGNELTGSVLCNTLWNVHGALHGLFSVNMHSKSKFIMVDGNNFSAVYQNEDQFIHRFGKAGSSVGNKASMKARMR